jgi:tRNA threonylcarbamoyladenosine biosynthesis protein TsaE
MEIITRNEKEFKDAAQQILIEGINQRIFLLYGDMGAGKTTMVQAWGEKLGLQRMTSPTFVVVKSYDLPIIAKFEDYEYDRLYHADLYRLTNKNEVEGVGIPEMIKEHKSLVMVEWPEIVEDMWPTTAVRIRIERLPGEDEARRIVVK